MFYISLVMGLLVGFLVDVWLGRATVKDPLRLILAVIAGVLVVVFTYTGVLPHF